MIPSTLVTCVMPFGSVSENAAGAVKRSAPPITNARNTGLSETAHALLRTEDDDIVILACMKQLKKYCGEYVFSPLILH